MLCTDFLLAADKAEWTKPIPVRRCPLQLFVTSSQWDAQVWKVDATSFSLAWHEQKGKEESCVQLTALKVKKKKVPWLLAQAKLKYVMCIFIYFFIPFEAVA